MICACGVEMLATDFGARCPRCGAKHAHQRAFILCDCGCGRPAAIRHLGLVWAPGCYLERFDPTDNTT